MHPSLGRALSSNPTLAPRFGCTFLHERCDTRALRLEPRSTPPIASRPTRPVTSLNEIECLGRFARWGSAGKGRSAPSEGEQPGSVSDCSEGLWGRRGDDPVDHRGDLGDHDRALRRCSSGTRRCPTGPWPFTADADRRRPRARDAAASASRVALGNRSCGATGPNQVLWSSDYSNHGRSGSPDQSRHDLGPIPSPALFLASNRRRRGREVLAWSSSTCSQFVQNPCDERVRAVPYRLERPPQGGSDLLTALARDEMPKN